MSCPICGKPTDPKYRPFCSKRCADIDLGKWLKGDYAIPGQETDDDEAVSREESTPNDRIH
ncbi:MAG: DNA gyrase inhibitor YacG [Pseudomonadota bacterium]